MTLYGHRLWHVNDTVVVQRCAGTLVSMNVVVTAAHCVCLYNSNKAGTCVTKRIVALNGTHNVTQQKPTKVIVGNHNTHKYDEGELVIDNFEIIPHEKYVSPRGKYTRIQKNLNIYYLNDE